MNSSPPRNPIAIGSGIRARSRGSRRSIQAISITSPPKIKKSQEEIAL